jgi:hypothetical protein
VNGAVHLVVGVVERLLCIRFANDRKWPFSDERDQPLTDEVVGPANSVNLSPGGPAAPAYPLAANSSSVPVVPLNGDQR